MKKDLIKVLQTNEDTIKELLLKVGDIKINNFTKFKLDKTNRATIETNFLDSNIGVFGNCFKRVSVTLDCIFVEDTVSVYGHISYIYKEGGSNGASLLNTFGDRLCLKFEIKGDKLIYKEPKNEGRTKIEITYLNDDLVDYIDLDIPFTREELFDEVKSKLKRDRYSEVFKNSKQIVVKEFNNGEWKEVSLPTHLLDLIKEKTK